MTERQFKILCNILWDGMIEGPKDTFEKEWKKITTPKIEIKTKTIYMVIRLNSNTPVGYYDTEEEAAQEAAIRNQDPGRDMFSSRYSRYVVVPTEVIDEEAY